MAKSTTFRFSKFEPCHILARTITSQCGNTGTVIIKAGGTTLETASKTTDGRNLKLQAQNHSVNDSNIVTETITNNESVELKNSLTAGAITDNNGRKGGCGYNICIDFNDVYVNPVGRARKGESRWI